MQQQFQHTLFTLRWILPNNNIEWKSLKSIQKLNFLTIGVSKEDLLKKLGPWNVCEESKLKPLFRAKLFVWPPKWLVWPEKLFAWALPRNKRTSIITYTLGKNDTPICICMIWNRGTLSQHNTLKVMPQHWASGSTQIWIRSFKWGTVKSCRPKNSK